MRASSRTTTIAGTAILDIATAQQGIQADGGDHQHAHHQQRQAFYNSVQAAVDAEQQ